MADAPNPGPTHEPPGLTLFDDEPATPRRDPAPPPPAPDAEPTPPGNGLRETILRFLEQEL
jgi:hypothetical protein